MAGAERVLVTAIGNRQKSIIGYIVFENPAISKGNHMYIESPFKVCTIHFLDSSPFVAYVFFVVQSFRAGVGEAGV